MMGFAITALARGNVVIGVLRRVSCTASGRGRECGVVMIGVGSTASGRANVVILVFGALERRTAWRERRGASGRGRVCVRLQDQAPGDHGKCVARGVDRKLVATEDGVCADFF